MMGSLSLATSAAKFFAPNVSLKFIVESVIRTRSTSLKTTYTFANALTAKTLLKRVKAVTT